MSDSSPDLAPVLRTSGMLWIQPPEERAWPAWHVCVEDTCYVVTGPGEQPLPDLPEQVTLILRTKDSQAEIGAQVAQVPARTHRVDPEDAEWQTATDALAPARLNVPEAGLARRWADSATVWALVPDLEAARTAPDEASGAAPPPATPATTDTWRPAHRPARPLRRRRQR